MLTQTSEIVQKQSYTNHNTECLQTFRVPTNLRPLLRVATEQQFSQISPIARVLIHQVELSQGITFHKRPQQRAACLELCRALASVIIARGC